MQVSEARRGVRWGAGGCLGTRVLFLITELPSSLPPAPDPLSPGDTASLYVTLPAAFHISLQSTYLHVIQYFREHCLK